MKHFTQSVSLIGVVSSVKAQKASFRMRCHGGDVFDVQAGPAIALTVLRKVDGLKRARPWRGTDPGIGAVRSEAVGQR